MNGMRDSVLENIQIRSAKTIANRDSGTAM